MEETNEEEKMYARACTEVLEILKDAPPEDISKIPKELMEALESKKDKEYKFEANSYMNFEDESISDIAKVMLQGIFKDYIMKQREDNQEKNVENNAEQKESIENNTKVINDKVENSEEQLALVEVKKESLYRKIIKFFKKLFHVKSKEDKLENIDE